MLIARTAAERARSWILGVAVAFDLGSLGVFKYYGFFVENWDRALGPVLAAAAAADDRAAGRRLVLHLPGDLLRRRRQAAAGGAGVDDRRRDLPELLPAPGRGADRAGARVPAAAAGAARSDAVAVGVGHRADRARAGEEAGDRGHARARRSSTRCSRCRARTPAPDLWLAAYAYTAQIYCDFSGYTDMAIGLALLMGYVFPQNFRSPYRATGFSDFWRRWHMTLSRFLRDFLYIPLGRQPQGQVEDLPQPDADDGRSAGSGTGRRGRSCSGASSTARACASSTRGAGG